MSIYLNQHDLLFIVETLRPGSAQPEQVAGWLQGDETRLFFTLLLRQAAARAEGNPRGRCPWD